MKTDSEQTTATVEATVKWLYSRARVGATMAKACDPETHGSTPKTPQARWDWGKKQCLRKLDEISENSHGYIEAARA